MMISPVSVSSVRFAVSKKLSQPEKDALKQEFSTKTAIPASDVAISPTGRITINNTAAGRALFPKFHQLSRDTANTGVQFKDGKFSFKGYPLTWANA